MSEEALQIAEKKREAKSKGEKERYAHLNAEFQRIVRRDTKGFPGGSEVKVSVSNVGDQGSIPGLGRSPEEGNGNPLQYSCLENPHGKRSLGSYNPWGHKESDMTEQLNIAQHY